MQSTPKGMRLHIGFFGRRNVGKSSLLNAITRQDVSLVSDQPGTTTDPVEKPMELLPFGPVLFIDTAGIDDEGALGEQRVERTRRIFDRTDLAVLVTDPNNWGAFEESLLGAFADRKIPVVVAINKIDVLPPSPEIEENIKKRKLQAVSVSALTGVGLDRLRQALLDTAPADFFEQSVILSDLVGPGEMAVLVVPIDKEAPKGRLILPQVQTIRDLLDGDSWCVVVKERELRDVLDRLNRPPAIVVTDSQAFLKVAADTPSSVPMTSFSILFARYRGDLVAQASGARAIDRLKPGDRILIAESCTHHPIADDIGRVKIPRWLTQFVGGQLYFDHVQGLDFPEDLTPYALVIHCGGCMTSRRVVLSRVNRCRQQGVPITNYGIAIAHSLGILERALAPFPAALDAWRKG
ncbi:MAG TPA: [FeFe] hydrogenase H-cluster maturation GTPase HydF [Candidatus Hydrogenedentes bacterium]|nr:[FeFe] hydrogenase H-cluster maturation GTPase HydF [Candidatus Hydrogenedentota bacterium]